MAISKLKLITITANASSLQDVIFEFVQLKNFHPINASTFINAVHGLKSLQSENSNNWLLQLLKEIEKDLAMEIPVVKFKDKGIQLNLLEETTKAIRQQLSNFEDNLKSLVTKKQTLTEILNQVKHIEKLEVSLDDLFTCKFVHARIGRIPTDNLEKLKYYQSRPFVIKTFETDEHFSWCIYLTTSEYEREVDNLFSSLFFSRIHIPDYVHGTPSIAIKQLAKEISDNENSINDIKEAKIKFIQKNLKQLSEIKGQLLFNQRMVAAKQYVVGIGDRITINGFTEDFSVDEVVKAYRGYDGVKVEIKDAEADRRILPPTKLKNNLIFKPFEMFVEMYGLPSYHSIDPTPFLAIAYTLLFGMMFGDLGQGLLLSLMAWVMSKFNKKNRLYRVGIRLGFSSAFFGLLYGSVFGNETWLNPFYENILGLPNKPIEVLSPEFTLTLLGAAIGVGVLLLLTSIILNIYVKFKNRNFIEGLLSHNGFAGIFLYGFLVMGFGLNLMGAPSIFNTLTISAFVFFPLILIFLKEPIHRLMHGEKAFPQGFGSYFTEGFFELFEVLLSYITNTMSYLRVGGFILSHAGMMLVVATLMNMVGNASLLVFILGNLFVMALEGLIVGIQVLRLQFYEMFSRYYEGNGTAFSSLLTEEA
ncbi:MAG: V-type ATP synthase subunit I [Bacilli bacterium]